MTGAPPQPPTDGKAAESILGLTAADGGRDTDDGQVESSKWRQFTDAMRLRHVVSIADDYPVVLKQFIQFCLILIYPGWVFTVLFGGLLTILFYLTVYPFLWLLFWPVRAHQKKHHPEEYAANRAKYAKH